MPLVNAIDNGRSMLFAARKPHVQLVPSDESGNQSDLAYEPSSGYRSPMLFLTPEV